MTAPVHLRLCPRLTVEFDGTSTSGHDLGSRKARTLLALLAVRRGRLLSVDEIADVLWPSSAPVEPAANVATLVSRLRRRIGAGVITGHAGAYGVLRDGRSTVDLDEAADLLDEAAARERQREPALVVTAASRALEMLGAQTALDDEPDSDWVQPVRGEAAQLRREARHLLGVALTTLGRHDEAIRHATRSAEVDPYDERAHRDLMLALVSAGRPAAAIEVYAGLARRLRDDLGSDPEGRTTDLQLAILRGEPPRSEIHSSPRGSHAPSIVGRTEETRTLTSAWERAAGGGTELMVVTGDAGIGKSRLLTELATHAARTGGLVLSTRCRAAERSLFLEPVVQLLRVELLRRPPDELNRLLGDDADLWAAFVPELREVLAAPPLRRGSARIERRRAYNSVTRVVHQLSRQQALLLVLDDLQEAGAATVDLLAYLRRHLGASPVLVVVAVRAEDAAAARRLRDISTEIALGPLTASAVAALVDAAGLGARSADVMERTAGHPLSVVETIRALSAGESAVPPSLAASILGRVDRVPDRTREALRLAAVLGVRVDPRQLAAMIEQSEVQTVRVCEDLTDARLLNRTGSAYEFVNDLVRDAVYGALPEPVRLAAHRRAADLLAEAPESMAAHAAAAGDPGRAAHGWLQAGLEAMRRSAVEDAGALFDLAAAAARDAAQPELLGRALLSRSHAHESATDFASALADAQTALTTAREVGDQRLEMAAHRALGGDTAVALRHPPEQWGGHLQAGLEIATALGDRRAEADLQARMCVLDCSRLRLSRGRLRAEANLDRARAVDDPEALDLALDGVKTVYMYLGDRRRLQRVVDELEPRLRRSRSTWLLHWTLFESCFVDAARGDWAAAGARVDAAIDLAHRSGHPSFTGFFLAHRGWFARLAGDLESALADGSAAMEQTSPLEHPWWFATAAGLLATSLVEKGRADEAAELSQRGLKVAGEGVAEAFELRCLAPLAHSTGEESTLVRATQILDRIDAPAGAAWVTGSDTYLLAAAAWERAGELERARSVAAPLVAATGPTEWAVIHRSARGVGERPARHVHRR
jgi:DNA-binding SARP family transcriptional activator